MMLWKQLADRLKKGMHGEDLLPAKDRAHKPKVKDSLPDMKQAETKVLTPNVHKSHTS